MNSRILSVLAACAAVSLAQTAPVTVLEIEMSDVVVYWENLPDLSKWAKSQAPVPFVQSFPDNAFKQRTMIGDVVSVNGTPAKGVFHALFKNIMGSRMVVPGRAIADVEGCLIEFRYVLLDAEQNLIGSIAGSGNSAAGPMPGAPNTMPPGLAAVVGGTGAFLGARGQIGHKGSARSASIAEDPAYRRINGGGRMTSYIQLLPMNSPQVLALPTGPAVYHADDFSPATPAAPARVGERLILSASGLGAVRPNLDPGEAFPPMQQGKLHEVNSPVGVTVNGKQAVVLNKVGWPTLNDVYRVDFVVPDGTEPGMATLGISVAWIKGPEVKVPIR